MKGKVYVAMRRDKLSKPRKWRQIEGENMREQRCGFPVINTQTPNQPHEDGHLVPHDNV